MTDPHLVESRIYDAFQAEAYPTGDPIVDGELGPEERKMQAAFAFQDWKTLSIHQIRPWRMHLSFFTPNAYRYFLPAFLIMGVRDGDHGYGYDISVYVYLNLIPPSELDSRDQFEKRTKELNLLQWRAIHDYVLWFLGDSPVLNSDDQRTLTYWSSRSLER